MSSVQSALRLGVDVGGTNTCVLNKYTRLLELKEVFQRCCPPRFVREFASRTGPRICQTPHYSRRHSRYPKRHSVRIDTCGPDQVKHSGRLHRNDSEIRLVHAPLAFLIRVMLALRECIGGKRSSAVGQSCSHSPVWPFHAWNATIRRVSPRVARP
jgi:hypothetical protein